MSYPATRKNEIFPILLRKEIIKIAYTYCWKKSEFHIYVLVYSMAEFL